MTPFSPTELALARSRGYDLLGRLLLGGPSPALFPQLRRVTALRSALPEAFAGAADELAADFHHLFALNLPPYGALYLDPGGLLGGEVADRHARRLAAVGYEAAGAPADHLGHALRALSHLCGAEADAGRDGLSAVAAALRERQRTLLAGLAGWIWPLLIALERQPLPLYRATGSLILDLLVDHLGGEKQLELSEVEPLPAATGATLLDDPQTGLREIARFLLAPPLSGWWLSRDDLITFGRSLELPAGFGSREQTLTNLLRAAGRFDRLPQFAALLEEIRRGWAEGYDRLESRVRPAGMVNRWSARLADVEAWTARLAASPPAPD